MEIVTQDIQEYTALDGKNHYREWFLTLGDCELEFIVQKRMSRLSTGNFGDHRSLGGGLFELRIHYGAGHRIYFGRKGSKLVILLHGGDKRTQSWDIKRARIYWEECLREGK